MKIYKIETNQLRNHSIKKFDLTGKTAIVTGGAGILGRGYARTLRENGANVIILDIDNLLIEKANLYFRLKRLLNRCLSILMKTKP